MAEASARKGVPMSRRPLTFEEAEMLLAGGDRVHTFVQATGGPQLVLVGADWDRAEILNIFRQACPAERVELAVEAFDQVQEVLQA